MNWTTYADVIQSLGLSLTTNTRAGILQAIKEEMAELHPDNVIENDGKFSSKHTEQRWHILNEAKEFVERYPEHSVAMIPIAQLPALINALRPPFTVSSTDARNTLLNHYSEISKRRMFLPKVTAGVVSAVCVFLVTASSALKDHPILGHFIMNTQVQTALLMLIAASAAMFLLLWLREGQRQSYLSWVLTSAGTRNVFLYLIRYRMDVREDSDGRFTLDDLTAAIARRRPRPSIMDPYRVLVGHTIDWSIAEESAKLMIARLLEEGIVTEGPKIGLDKTYVIPEQIMRETRNRR